MKAKKELKKKPSRKKYLKRYWKVKKGRDKKRFLDDNK